MSRLTTKLLKEYKAAVDAAYAELAIIINGLAEKNMEKVDFDKAVKRAAGRCGAYCSAAMKRISRDFVLGLLLEQRKKGLDITPTVAQHVCDRNLGRGVDKSKTLEAFATPGRTAADKSTLTADGLVNVEQQIQVDLQALGVETGKIKAKCVADYKAGRYT